MPHGSSGKAVIYARFSTDRQDARSIDDQERRCREYASRNNLEVIQLFADEALSGSHTERPQLQALLTQAQSRHRPFTVVLIDDLSRLSRDLFDLGRMIFQEFQALGIQVIDVMTGTSSDAPIARQMFAAMGMSNDFFLQMVKAETHRGLEGRAIAGFSTGGRTFGYSTIPEPNPQDPLHPRAVPVINEQEADIVRKIFEWYAKGESLNGIAAKLNSLNVTATYDKHPRKTLGKGWGHQTIKGILRNERYIGVITWNKRKNVRVPGKRNPRAIPRPKSEWRTLEVPQLAIVSQELWNQVQARNRKSIKGGRPVTATKQLYLTSGLLKCGVCGNSMGIVGSTTKKGKRYSSFGCLTHHARGNAICPNTHTVSDRKITQAVIEALKTTLNEPGLIDRLVKQTQANLKRQQPQDPSKALKAELLQAQLKVRNLTEAIGKMGFSSALAKSLKDGEALVKQLEDQLKVTRLPTTPDIVANPSDIKEAVTNLFETLERSIPEANALLTRHVKSVTLTPEIAATGAKIYRMKSDLNLVGLKPDRAVIENLHHRAPDTVGNLVVVKLDAVIR